MNIRTYKLISSMQNIICMSNTQPIQQLKVIAPRIKIQQGHKSDVLKEMHNINNKYQATKYGYKNKY